MRLAIDLVKEGRAAAMVSAGNTGALTAMSHFVLKTVGPVERAPIMSMVPARNGGQTHMLDLGANSKATGLQLAQFATMGSIVARDVFGISNPRIGLLNIGEEETKGHELVQEAHELIRASGVNYLGFVEGNNIFDGSVDVVVTDGFTGNVCLKLLEALAEPLDGVLVHRAQVIVRVVRRAVERVRRTGAPLVDVQCEFRPLLVPVEDLGVVPDDHVGTRQRRDHGRAEDDARQEQTRRHPHRHARRADHHVRQRTAQPVNFAPVPKAPAPATPQRRSSRSVPRSTRCDADGAARRRCFRGPEPR